jgi:hypothetical protein
MNFDDVKRKEMLMEKQMFAKARHQEPPPPGGTAWRRPVLITLNQDSNLPHRGCNSTERDTQKKREEGVLFALYFQKNM